MSKITIVEGNSNDKDNVRALMVKGERGYSAYEIAVQNGYEGTEAEWKDSFLNAENYYNKTETDNLLDEKTCIYDTVALMKAGDLKDGMTAQTLGYYAVNDGGGATYKIVNDDTLVDDGGSIHVLTNGLRAKLIIKDNMINIKQLGAKPQDNLNKYDIKGYIDSYLDIQNNLKSSLKLYIPSGIWYTSGNQFHSKYGIHIEGDEKFSSFHTFANGTIITTYNNNQDYIFQLGNTNNVCHNWVLKNLVFSSSDFTYQNDIFNFDSLKSVTKALELHYAEYGISDNLFFIGVKGNCLSISSSWENYFKLLNFRKVTNHNGNIINFETADNNLGGLPNITANNFEKIMFERVHGNLMNFEARCAFHNNHFGTINVEDYSLTLDGEEYTKLTDDNIGSYDDDQMIHHSVFNLEANATFSENVIDSLELNNFGLYVYTWNNNTYIYDTITNMSSNNCSNANIYDTITLAGGYKKVKVIYLKSSVTDVVQGANYSTYNNFVTDIKNGFMFDVNGLPGIFGSNAVLTGVIPDSYNRPTTTPFQNGGWIPCYKTKPNRQYNAGEGLGALYYDADSSNNLKLVVKPRTENINLDRPFLTTIVNPNKKFYLRAKIPNGESVKIYLSDITNNTSVAMEITGDGTYKVYSAEFTAEQNIGDIIAPTISSNANFQRNIMCDVFISI